MTTRIIRYVHSGGILDDAALTDTKDDCIRNLKNMEATGLLSRPRQTSSGRRLLIWSKSWTVQSMKHDKPTTIRSLHVIKVLGCLQETLDCPGHARGERPPKGTSSVID